MLGRKWTNRFEKIGLKLKTNQWHLAESCHHLLWNFLYFSLSLSFISSSFLHSLPPFPLTLSLSSPLPSGWYFIHCVFNEVADRPQCTTVSHPPGSFFGLLAERRWRLSEGLAFGGDTLLTFPCLTAPVSGPFRGGRWRRPRLRPWSGTDPPWMGPQSGLCLFWSQLTSQDVSLERDL